MEGCKRKTQPFCQRYHRSRSHRRRERLIRSDRRPIRDKCIAPSPSKCLRMPQSLCARLQLAASWIPLLFKPSLAATCAVFPLRRRRCVRQTTRKNQLFNIGDTVRKNEMGNASLSAAPAVRHIFGTNVGHYIHK